jgi:triacylglycerol esterase/lipase EstA (alpha/beta hydrolase family)
MPTTACGEGAYTANGIKNYSWNGTSSFTNTLRPFRLFLWYYRAWQVQKPNDGLVGKCSSHFGKVFVMIILGIMLMPLTILLVYKVCLHQTLLMSIALMQIVQKCRVCSILGLFGKIGNIQNDCYGAVVCISPFDLSGLNCGC